MASAVEFEGVAGGPRVVDEVTGEMHLFEGVVSRAEIGNGIAGEHTVN